MGSKGWVLPPSLTSVPAVPGEPVIETELVIAINPVKDTEPEARMPKDASIDESPEDAYQRLMAVPAVPDSSSVTQSVRKPKDSLNSVQFSLNRLNTQQLPNPRNPVTSAQDTKAPTFPTTEGNKNEERRKFKRC